MTHKVMVIYDVHVETPNGRITWAYGRRAAAIKKYAPPDFEVETYQYSEVPWERCGQMDLVFQLEYAAINRVKIKGHKPNPNVPVVVSYNSDSRRRREYWDRAYPQADYVIVNNQEMFEFKNRPFRTCCISNGVDTEIFRPDVPIAERAQKCIFAGSTGPTKMKGWPEVFRPLEKMLPEHGFVTEFRPVDDINPKVVMPTESTVDWYNSASYVLIASLSEGTPNLATEGVACGCILVTVPVGNVLEWGKDSENCVFAERNAESFVQALLYAREHRERLSTAGMQTICNGWSYGPPGYRADHYFALFRALIAGRVPEPFCYNEVSPEQI